MYCSKILNLCPTCKGIVAKLELIGRKPTELEKEQELHNSKVPGLTGEVVVVFELVYSYCKNCKTKISNATRSFCGGLIESKYSDIKIPGLRGCYLGDYCIKCKHFYGMGYSRKQLVLYVG